METKRPNIVFIMSDDHAAHAISAYGSRVNRTPHMDRIAQGGLRLDNCFCTNSICTPSRASILTGQYGHVTGVKGWEPLDNRRPIQVQKLLQKAGYATAMIGKWHLGRGLTNSVWHDDNRGPNAVPADPAGFDHWCVLPGQGAYYDPDFYTAQGKVNYQGYASDIITDLALEWLDGRDQEQPFFLCVHHKAPHRPWNPGEKYKHLYENEEIPQPETFDDDYAGRPAAAAAKMRISSDLIREDVKADPPQNLSEAELKNWYYQRYIKDYLRCVASVDASVGRLLDYLDGNNLADDTIVIYTSDQGFFLGDHGWYDKRFIYEESLRMPFLMRYPREIAAGQVGEAMLTNTDFAPTLLDYAGLAAPAEMQGVSARTMLRGETPGDWQTSLYYRYWNNGGHHVAAHYGIRTQTHKLIYVYSKPLGTVQSFAEPALEPYWELFDLTRDPRELNNIYDDPANAALIAELQAELERLQAKYGDEPLHG